MRARHRDWKIHISILYIILCVCVYFVSVIVYHCHFLVFFPFHSCFASCHTQINGTLLTTFKPLLSVVNLRLFEVTVNLIPKLVFGVALERYWEDKVALTGVILLFQQPYLHQNRFQCRIHPADRCSTSPHTGPHWLYSPAARSDLWTPVSIPLCTPSGPCSPLQCHAACPAPRCPGSCSHWATCTRPEPQSRGSRLLHTRPDPGAPCRPLCHGLYPAPTPRSTTPHHQSQTCLQWTCMKQV